LTEHRSANAISAWAPERLLPAALVGSYPQPDCGMKYLTRAAAYGKMTAMVAGAALVRRELTA